MSIESVDESETHLLILQVFVPSQCVVYHHLTHGHGSHTYVCTYIWSIMYLHTYMSGLKGLEKAIYVHTYCTYVVFREFYEDIFNLQRSYVHTYVMTMNSVISVAKL